MQLVTASTKAPLFSTCTNSVISYSGDYFGAQQNPGFNINFQCLTPTTYSNFFTSRAKLATVIGICQNAQHGCKKAGNQVFNTAAGSNNAYAGLPSLQSLALVTTSKYYQWYSQYASISVVNNVVRCPTAYVAAAPGLAGINRCNCNLVNFPELFTATNAKMPSSTSDSYRTISDIPSPVNPYSSYSLGFLGQYSNINPFPSVSGSAAALLLQARLVQPTITHPVHLGCIDDDVDITSECD